MSSNAGASGAGGEPRLSSGVAAAGVGQVGAYLFTGIVILASFYDPDTKSKVRAGLWPVVAQFPLLWFGLLLTIYAAARVRKESIRTLTGFSVRPKDAFYALIGVALQYGGGFAYSLFGQSEEVRKPADELVNNARNNTFGFFVLALAVGVGAPLVEELFYRGLVARALERRFDHVFGSANTRTTLVLSVMLSALWFGAIHGQPLQFPVLFLVGAVCAVLVLRVRRLGPAIFVHVGFNLTTVIALGLDLRSSTGAIWRF